MDDRHVKHEEGNTGTIRTLRNIKSGVNVVESCLVLVSGGVGGFSWGGPGKDSEESIFGLSPE